MLNPFIFGPKGKWKKDSRPIREERYIQDHGTPVSQPAARNRLTLRLGLLLIRMGKGLAGERAFQNDPEDHWFYANQTKTRPARFHHA